MRVALKFECVILLSLGSYPLRSLTFQCWDHFAHVGTVFPPCADPYGCARGDFCARRGGTYEVKLGSYQEGAHRQSEIDDTRGERHILRPLTLFLVSSIKETGFLQEKSEQDPQTTRGRDAVCGEMDFAAFTRGFEGAR